jgi:hypothetical protein
MTHINWRSMSLAQLEFHAIRRGVFVEDRDVVGAEHWQEVLTTRLENGFSSEITDLDKFRASLEEVAAEVEAKIESGELADPCPPAFSDPRFVAAPTPPGGFVHQPASGSAKMIGVNVGSRTFSWTPEEIQAAARSGREWSETFDAAVRRDHDRARRTCPICGASSLNPADVPLCSCGEP